MPNPYNTAGKASGASAIVHDWLTGMRGGEKCLRTFCELLPQADLFTLHHKKGSVDPVIESHRLQTSFLQVLPGIDRYYRYMLPLFPLAVEGLNLYDYSFILSISHCVAKGIVPGPKAFHVCYCLSPMRYVWDMYPLYFGREEGKKLPGGVIRAASHYLRLWDVAASARVDEFVAVSGFVAARIRKFYRRKARVIYPPIEWDRFKIDRSSSEKGYYLVVSADARYKRLDLALEAFSQNGRRVKIAGRSCHELKRRWRKRGAKNIEWLGWVSDSMLQELYANCRALVYPGPEDFGLVSLEAQASGRPVIAYGQGGVLESTRGIFVQDVRKIDGSARHDGYTGLFFSDPNAKSLTEAIECFETIEEWFDPDHIRQWAKQFDRQVFMNKWKNFLQKHI